MTAEPWLPLPPEAEDYRVVPGFCSLHGQGEPCVRCGVVKLRAGMCPGCGFDLDAEANCAMCGRTWPKL